MPSRRFPILRKCTADHPRLQVTANNFVPTGPSLQALYRRSGNLRIARIGFPDSSSVKKEEHIRNVLFGIFLDDRGRADTLPGPTHGDDPCSGSRATRPGSTPSTGATSHSCASSPASPSSSRPGTRAVLSGCSGASGTAPGGLTQNPQNPQNPHRRSLPPLRERPHLWTKWPKWPKFARFTHLVAHWHLVDSRNSSCTGSNVTPLTGPSCSDWTSRSALSEPFSRSGRNTTVSPVPTRSTRKGRPPRTAVVPSPATLP